MSERIATLSAFWPYYLSEHRDPRSRALHFVGTSGFFACVLTNLWMQPVWFGGALLVSVGVGWIGSQIVEGSRPAFLPAGLILVLCALGSAPFLLGVIFAYACAWVGHFQIEGNRPATFRYPLWSLICDFRMWGRMATGQLWSGDPATT
jgi:hypothetical protein